VRSKVYDAGMTLALRIKDVAERAATTTFTLRYYESIGLLRPKRAANGHRRYDEDDVRRVIFWRKLHETGMPIRTMRAYAKLLAKGDATAADRKAILVAHREAILERLGTLKRNLGMIEKKIAFYDELCGDMRIPQ